jgi:hypothetical protein
MSKPRFLVKLKKHHEKTGLSAYAVAKQLRLNAVTVQKYVSADVYMEFLPNHVLKLAEFYGLDWRDPDVIEVVAGDDTSDEDELKTPTAISA